MKKKVLLLLCSVFLVFGLIACGNKEKIDKNKNKDTNTKTESTTDKKNDEETIVFTNENVDAIVEKNKIEVIGKFVSSKEVTEDDDYNTVEEDENGNIKYMVYTWSYEMKDGTKLEVIENYSNPDRPNAFYSLALKDANGKVVQDDKTKQNLPKPERYILQHTKMINSYTLIFRI